MRRSGSRARRERSGAACARRRCFKQPSRNDWGQAGSPHLSGRDRRQRRSARRLRFAARRAAKTKGNVEVLAVVAPQDFVQWGGVQAAIEEEQSLRIEGIVSAAGRRNFRRGRDQAAKSSFARAMRSRSCAIISMSRDDIAALVLGAAPAAARASGGAFQRQGFGQPALPGDDHPRLAQRGTARAAKLERAAQHFCKTDAAGFVFCREAGRFRAVEIEDSDQLASRTIGTTSSLTLAESQAIWPSKAWTSSTRCPPGSPRRPRTPRCRTRCGCRRRGPGTARAPVRHRCCGRSPPVEVGQRLPDQRRRIGHVGDRVGLAGDQPLERRGEVVVHGGRVRSFDLEVVHFASSLSSP